MKAVTYIMIDGEEIELDQVSDAKLKELGLEQILAERKAQSETEK